MLVCYGLEGWSRRLGSSHKISLSGDLNNFAEARWFVSVSQIGVKGWSECLHNHSTSQFPGPPANKLDEVHEYVRLSTNTLDSRD